MFSKNLRISVLFLSLLGFASCSGGLDDVPLTDEEIYANDVKIINDYLEEAGLLDSVIVTETGLRYVVLQEGTGYSVDSLDVAKMNYVGMRFDSVKFTPDGNGAEFTAYGRQNFNVRGINEGLDSMRVGSKYLFLIPSRLAYGRSDFAAIPANNPILYSIEILELQREKIDNWIVENDYQDITTTLPSGLRYVMLNDVPGNNIIQTSSVKAYYEGRLLYNNTKFDGNFGTSTPFSFSLGTISLIQGWEEGLTYLSEGDSALLVIPSPLGYEFLGSGTSIPPNAPLVFTMKIQDVN